jgi:hypothetical protein
MTTEWIVTDNSGAERDCIIAFYKRHNRMPHDRAEFSHWVRTELMGTERWKQIEEEMRRRAVVGRLRMAWLH